MWRLVLRSEMPNMFSDCPELARWIRTKNVGIPLPASDDMLYTRLKTTIWSSERQTIRNEIIAQDAINSTKWNFQKQKLESTDVLIRRAYRKLIRDQKQAALNHYQVCACIHVDTRSEIMDCQSRT
jgi:hypothetical protein